MPVPGGDDGSAANSYPESANIDLKRKKEEESKVQKRENEQRKILKIVQHEFEFGCKINIRSERKLSQMALNEDIDGQKDANERLKEKGMRKSLFRRCFARVICTF